MIVVEPDSLSPEESLRLQLLIISKDILLGKAAMKLLAEKYDYKQPTYEKYVHLAKQKKNKIKIEKIK